MASQPEIPNYDVGVYQLTLTDPVQGGLGGVSNEPLLNLANRTAWLYQELNLVMAGTFIPPTVAPLLSPILSGSPTTPTPPLGDSSLKIANTAFVQGTIAGVLSLSVAGGTNVSLTAMQAGNGTLTFTGGLTANISVIVPNSPSKWIVANLTTGAFTLTVKTAAGAGVAVSQNKTQSIACDGTNVFLASNDFSNVALTGVPTSPTATPGTNTSQVASTAFVTAAVSAVTSGYALLAGSATQVFNVGPAVSASNAVQLSQVQARGVNSSGVLVVGATGGLPLTVSGGLVILNGVITAGLPPSTSLPVGARISLMAYAPGAVLIPQGTDTLILSSSGGSSSVTFGLNDTLILENTGSGTYYAVGGTIPERGPFDLRYAQIAGVASQLFSAANATAAAHVVNRQFGDARYAALAGIGTQQFAVAAATVGGNAVNLTQMNAAGDHMASVVTATVTGGSAAVNGLELITVAGIQRALPSSVAAGAGATIKFAAFAAGCFISPSGTDVILSISGVPLGATVVFGVGDTAELVTSGGGSWYLVGGSMALKYAANIKGLGASNGYQKFPSGLILQWGNGTTTASGATTPVFPIAFPNACVNVVSGPQAAGVGSMPNFGWQIVGPTGFNLYGSTTGLINYSYFAIGF
jgi:hypothetical protein